MRPSRSHESLSSPLKGSMRLNQVAIRNNSIYQHHLTEFNSGSKPKFVRMNPTSASMKPSRLSHPTTPTFKAKANNSSTDDLQVVKSLNHNQIVDSIIKLSFTGTGEIGVNAIHNSLLNEENCYELKCHFNTITVVNSTSHVFSSENDEDEENFHPNNEDDEDLDHDSNANSTRQQLLKYYASTPLHFPLYFMCRSNEEKEKWIQCLRGVIEPNFLQNRRDENALQLWILEAKGQAISSKPNKKYFCHVLLNNVLFARTCCKLKKEILFWGENFDFK